MVLGGEERGLGGGYVRGREEGAFGRFFWEVRRRVVRERGVFLGCFFFGRSEGRRLGGGFGRSGGSGACFWEEERGRGGGFWVVVLGVRGEERGGGGFGVCFFW